MEKVNSFKNIVKDLKGKGEKYGGMEPTFEFDEKRAGNTILYLLKKQRKMFI